MSILKRVVTEALVSLSRRSPPENSPKRDATVSTVDERDKPPLRSQPSKASTSGMKAIVLNWKSGENDPFSVVTDTVRQHFRACGKNIEVVEISQRDWPTRLNEFLPGGVEFVLTWQGLGSSATAGAPGESLWDHLKIPLICIHGDHPSHMPLNHQLESPYCFHLYTNAEFARYSNRHFRRKRSATVIDIPQLHREPRLRQRSGDYFVVAKNISDPLDTERHWRQQLDKRVFDAYMMAAETLKYRITQEPYVDIHDVLDELIAQRTLEWFDAAANPAGYHHYHSQLDHYLRSHKGVAALKAIGDFPVHVYGRGWDRIAQSAPKSHMFLPGRNMAESQDLYYTRLGVIDISPAKGLHDRTRRAMVNGSAFLSSANLEDSFDDLERFAPLFFSFMNHELVEKCASVLRDPEAHLALAQDFGRMYYDRFHFKDFVNQIDHLAKLASQF